jgi:tetratricopeptide (TPR) repeat protein
MIRLPEIPSARTLALTGVGVLALLVIAGGIWFWYGSQLERAQGLHGDALAQAYNARTAPPDAGNPVRPAAVRALESALSQAPNAALAPQSAYELGNLRFDQRDFAGARAAYEIALGNARKSPTLRTLARAGIASTWEAQRDFPKAIDAYSEAVRDEKPGQFQYEDLLISLGRVQELAGRREDAIQSYRRLLKDAAKLKRESEVRGRLASLGAAG